MLTRKSILTMTTAAALCAAPVLAFGQGSSAGSATGGSSQMQGTTQNAPNASSPGYTSNPSGSLAPSVTGPATGPAAGNDARSGVAQANPRDGTPGNPPSTATQRAVDSVTGNRTDPDGTGNNPPGTAAGRAVDRATGSNSAATDTPANRPNGVTGPNSPANTGTQRPSTAATTPAAPSRAATGATSGTMAVDSARIHGGRRASRVIGSTVYNENNETVGEVDDILIPTGSTQPVAVISVGGFLGIGARLVAVPYERLQQGERDRWTLPGATKDSLQGLPAFTYEDNGSGNNRRG